MKRKIRVSYDETIEVDEDDEDLAEMAAIEKACQDTGNWHIEHEDFDE